jgi:predicted alpha/beta superfamily hydrolase
MKKIIFLIFLFVTTASFAQKLDTLTVFSEAFQEERTIYIKTPRNFKYKSNDTRFPVIYILDGQHNWFVDPVLSTVEGLQMTKDMPQHIVVIIPHENRILESKFQNFKKNSALHQFITNDLNDLLEKYGVNEHRILIGHSFTASFALYSYLKKPGFYQAVIANTPLYKFEYLITEHNKIETLLKNKIYMSVGGTKDQHHKKKWDELQEKYPNYFKDINTYEAGYSSHNAVPIVTTPIFLTKIFDKYSKRYYKIAEVNSNYQLVKKPDSPFEELEKIKSKSFISGVFLTPEIADLNGIASRFSNNNYPHHAKKVYELGLKYYPKFWGFHLSLYQLLKREKPEKALMHLSKAERYLDELDNSFPEYTEIKRYISKENTAGNNGYRK